MRPSLVAVAVAVSAALLAGCGGDDLSRDEFIEELTADDAMDEARAICVYEEIDGQQDVLDDIRDHGGEDLSDETTNALELAVARCVVKESEADTDGGG